MVHCSDESEQLAENEVSVDCKIRTHKCCVPGCANNNSNGSFFRRLPNCPLKHIPTASDQVRRTYAIKCFKRKEWLRRFGLKESVCPRYVLYCNNHILEKPEVEISYKMQDGSEHTITTDVNLPRDNNDTEMLTRQDHRKRQIVEQIPPVT